MMFLKVTALLITVLFSFSVKAQDCTIDVGGKNNDVLVSVFQMNEEQVAKMESLKSELHIETKVVKDEIQKLFDTHPSSTPEELTELSVKYKVLQEKIVMASKATDKMLLSSFNVKQYERYLELCHEAIRRPIKIVPVALKDSISDPK